MLARPHPARRRCAIATPNKGSQLSSPDRHRRSGSAMTRLGYVERYWHRMLHSRSWAARALNWSMFNQIKERTPLLRPKLRLRYPELQALAVL